ncbi:MAG: hypothetical protein LUG16_00390 [Candidatus Gastranaerophilales bacterium]|nr:hypothetical protein [Candidatus Gastranaerophilales bacterium]
MNIKSYFKDIKNKINRLNMYVSNPVNYKDINNPFSTILPKTYVWLEEDITACNNTN